MGLRGPSRRVCVPPFSCRSKLRRPRRVLAAYGRFPASASPSPLPTSISRSIPTSLSVSALLCVLRCLITRSVVWLRCRRAPGRIESPASSRCHV
ncbi:hypothetical protein BDV93DRAFT_239846 [Ceratobasidium sp. AG-I]|nr:hypothetical protein BDV93DRAFT_239846 [Ceratobasidium sp. AG-I]